MINVRGLFIFLYITFCRIQYFRSYVGFEVIKNSVEIYRYDRKYKHHKFKIKYPIAKFKLFK